MPIIVLPRASQPAARCLHSPACRWMVRTTRPCGISAVPRRVSTKARIPGTASSARFGALTSGLRKTAHGTSAFGFSRGSPVSLSRAKHSSMCLNPACRACATAVYHHRSEGQNRRNAEVPRGVRRRKICSHPPSVPKRHHRTRGEGGRRWHPHRKSLDRRGDFTLAIGSTSM